MSLMIRSDSRVTCDVGFVFSDITKSDQSLVEKYYKIANHISVFVWVMIAWHSILSLFTIDNFFWSSYLVHIEKDESIL